MALLRRAAPLALALTLLTACSGGSSQGSPDDGVGSGGAPVRGGDLTVAIADYCGAFDKQQTSGCTFANIDLTDNLVDQDPETGEIVPWLATSWDVENGGARYVFHLREGVTFSNGEPFDAEVVKENFDGIIDLGEQGKSFQGAAYLRGYVNSEVIDPLTVAVNFEAPKAGVLQAFSERPLSFVARETLARTADERAAEGVIGTGPFVLDELVAHDTIRLVKREGYSWGSPVADHQDEAYLDSVTFKVVPEGSVRVGTLLSQQVDVASQPPSQSIPQIEAADGFTLANRFSSGVVYQVRPNYTHPVLSQEAPRRAVQVALDRQQIVDTVYDRFSQPATNIVSQNFPGWTDLSDDLVTDPDAVREILSADGWAKGSDGVWVKDGLRFSFDIQFTANDDQPLYELIQQQLRAVGIEVSVTKLTEAQVAANKESGDWGAMGGNLSRPDPDVFLSSFDPAFSTYNYTDLDPGLTELIRAQAVELDPALRTELSRQIQTEIVEEGLAWPLREGSQALAATPDVQGLRFTAPYWPSFYDTWKRS